MELVTPGLGLIFWMTVAFLAILFLLKKYAWIPILTALKERETNIDAAIHSADKAREEMKQLKFSNEQLLREAKNERDIILAEARKLKDDILEKSKVQAQEEYTRRVDSALESIQNEKMAAITDLKNQIANLSLEVAEKILQRELSDPKKQEDFIKQLITEIKFN
jgi:F-type H+-transporting ATPase subunit b